MERLPSFAHALLAGAESTEVLSRLGHDVIIKLKGDATDWLIVNRDIEEASTTIGRHGESNFKQVRSS